MKINCFVALENVYFAPYLMNWEFISHSTNENTTNPSLFLPRALVSPSLLTVSSLLHFPLDTANLSVSFFPQPSLYPPPLIIAGCIWGDGCELLLNGRGARITPAPLTANEKHWMSVIYEIRVLNTCVCVRVCEEKRERGRERECLCEVNRLTFLRLAHGLLWCLCN